MIAGIVYPIMMQHLLEDVGFAWAVRIFAFVMLVPLGVALLVIRPRKPATESGPLVDLRCFREPTYTTFVLGKTMPLLPQTDAKDAFRKAGPSS